MLNDFGRGRRAAAGNTIEQAGTTAGPSFEQGLEWRAGEPGLNRKQEAFMTGDVPVDVEIGGQALPALSR